MAGWVQAGLPRDGEVLKFTGATSVEREGDHGPGAYADKVREARKKFHKGDLFEAVLSQTFYRPCPAPPSTLFRRLRTRNPAPYCFVVSLGDDEWLVGYDRNSDIILDHFSLECFPALQHHMRARVLCSTPRPCFRVSDDHGWS